MRNILILIAAVAIVVLLVADAVILVGRGSGPTRPDSITVSIPVTLPAPSTSAPYVDPITTADTFVKNAKSFGHPAPTPAPTHTSRSETRAKIYNKKMLDEPGTLVWD